MKINFKSTVIWTLCALLFLTFCKQESKVPTTSAGSPEPEWLELYNGKDFTGWKANERDSTWTIVDGTMQAYGNRSHLYYIGDQLKDTFKNFELVAIVKTHHLANSGIYFHTQWQESGWPTTGFEIQVNNSHIGAGDYVELKKAGSLYGTRNIYKSFVKDSVWYETRALVEGKRVQIWLNGLKTVDYTEPENYTGNKLSKGTFCLQGHDTLSKIQYKSIKVRRLPDNAMSDTRAATFGPWYDSMRILQNRQMAFIDLHPHTTMNVGELIDYFYASGINVSEVKELAQAGEISSTADKPIFTGVLVNAANVKDLNPNAADYVISESKDLDEAKTVITSGKTNIWSHQGVALTVKNSTPLLDLAKKYKVAIEIDNESKTPSIEVLKLAKSKGCTFTFANIVPASKMDASMYVIDAIKSAGISYKDLYVPKR